MRHSAHNSYFQPLRENGFVSGGIIILLMIFSLLGAAGSLRIFFTGMMAAFAIGAIFTLKVGATAGHYVIGQTAGVYVFLLAKFAMACGSFAEESAHSQVRGMQKRIYAQLPSYITAE
jgi:hypothetical protein